MRVLKILREKWATGHFFRLCCAEQENRRVRQHTKRHKKNTSSHMNRKTQTSRGYFGNKAARLFSRQNRQSEAKIASISFEDEMVNWERRVGFGGSIFNRMFDRGTGTVSGLLGHRKQEDGPAGCIKLTSTSFMAASIPTIWPTYQRSTANIPTIDGRDVLANKEIPQKKRVFGHMMLVV